MLCNNNSFPSILVNKNPLYFTSIDLQCFPRDFYLNMKKIHDSEQSDPSFWFLTEQEHALFWDLERNNLERQDKARDLLVVSVETLNNIYLQTLSMRNSHIYSHHEEV